MECFNRFGSLFNRRQKTWLQRNNRKCWSKLFISVFNIRLIFTTRYNNSGNLLAYRPFGLLFPDLNIHCLKLNENIKCTEVSFLFRFQCNGVDRRSRYYSSAWNPCDGTISVQEGKPWPRKSLGIYTGQIKQAGTPKVYDKREERGKGSLESPSGQV